MIILGIDSTGDELLIGLSQDGQIIIKKGEAKPHSRSLFPLIRRLLKKKRPDAIAVSVGPGSYTGTRIGVVTANTLGWAWMVPVYGVAKRKARTLSALVKEGQRRYTQGDRSSIATPLYKPLDE